MSNQENATSEEDLEELQALYDENVDQLDELRQLKRCPEEVFENKTATPVNSAG